MFTAAYYGLFRVGEIMLSEHMVKAIDVHVDTNKNKLLFILRSSKTHTKGNHPQIIKISGEKKKLHGHSSRKLNHMKISDEIPYCCPFRQSVHFWRFGRID